MPARLFPKSFCYAVAITSIFLREEVRCLRRLHLNAASRRAAIILLNSTMRNNLQQQQQQLQLHCMLLQQLVLLLSHSASHLCLYLSVMRPRAHSLAAALCLCLCLAALPAFWQLLCEVRASRAFSFVFSFGALGSNCNSSRQQRIGSASSRATYKK